MSDFTNPTKDSSEGRKDRWIADGKMLFESGHMFCSFQRGSGYKVTFRRMGFSLFLQWEHPREGDGAIEIPEEQATQMLEWLTTEGEGADTLVRLRAKVDDNGRTSSASNRRMLECLARCSQYLKAHPGATWRELFKKVPNHYANLYSFSNSMRYRPERDAKKPGEAAGQNSDES